MATGTQRMAPNEVNPSGLPPSPKWVAMGSGSRGCNAMYTPATTRIPAR